MEQTATPGGPGLPHLPKQALAVYQHLFQRPAGHGQLQAALQQGREGLCPPSGLELPAELLVMERNRRTQEQLLWDLKLVCGAGLGLFWPPWVQFCGLRDQVRCAWSQQNRPEPACLGGGSEQPKNGSSRLCSSPQAGDSLSLNHPFSEGGQVVSALSALHLLEAGRGTAPRRRSPGRQTEPTSGLQELDSATRSRFGEPGGGSEFRGFTQREEKGQADPETRRHSPPPSRSLLGRSLACEAPGPLSLRPQALPGPQGGPQVLGWCLVQERAELQKLLRIEIPQQRQREEALPETEANTPQGQRREAPQGQNNPASQGRTGAGPKSPSMADALEQTKAVPQGQEGARLQPPGGRTSPGGEAAPGAAHTRPGEESEPQRVPGDSCRPLGERMPRPGGWESPDPGGRPTQRRQGQSPASAAEEREPGPVPEGVRAPLPPPAGLRPPDPGPPSTVGSGQPERPAGVSRLPAPRRVAEQEVGEGRGLRGRGAAWLRGALGEARGALGEARGALGEARGALGEARGALGEARGAAEAPKASRAAWPEPSGKEKASAGVSAAQQEAALQRLLELHGAARSRRRQARERQRRRVLERLHIARSRHCRVHPLEPSPSPVQLPPQEDTAGQRRALRQQLEHTHQERTRQLRALGARNTQSFQQLLWPEPVDGPAPGK